jgi:hypothetical protein
MEQLWNPVFMIQKKTARQIILPDSLFIADGRVFPLADRTGSPLGGILIALYCIKKR